MNYQSFLEFHVLQVTLYKKKLKFNWIFFFMSTIKFFYVKILLKQLL